jgi:hypothetical protein
MPLVVDAVGEDVEHVLDAGLAAGGHIVVDVWRAD